VTNGLGYLLFSSGSIEVAIGRPIFPVSSWLDSFYRNDARRVEWSKMPKLYQWFGILAIVISTTAHAQDMSDQAGDSIRGRQTMPLAIGDFYARVVLSLGVGFWTLLCLNFWEITYIEGSLLEIVGLIVAVRTVTLRTVAQDKITFRIWNGWIVCVYALPFLKTVCSPSYD
jgi:4-hydroxybenzoate polyprenyltransferase